VASCLLLLLLLAGWLLLLLAGWLLLLSSIFYVLCAWETIEFGRRKRTVLYVRHACCEVEWLKIQAEAEAVKGQSRPTKRDLSRLFRKSHTRLGGIHLESRKFQWRIIVENP